MEDEEWLDQYCEWEIMMGQLKEDIYIQKTYLDPVEDYWDEIAIQEFGATLQNEW